MPPLPKCSKRAVGCWHANSNPSRTQLTEAIGSFFKGTDGVDRSVKFRLSLVSGSVSGSFLQGVSTPNWILIQQCYCAEQILLSCWGNSKICQNSSTEYEKIYISDPIEGHYAHIDSSCSLGGVSHNCW